MDIWNDSNPGTVKPRRPVRRLVAVLTVLLAAAFLVVGGCAKYNTYYNAKKAFDAAERARDERLKAGDDAATATRGQKQGYDLAIRKAQKVLDEYPGHGLTDDVLFLQGKAYQRLASYRMSIRKLDLLFTNFPQTEHLEESLFLQAVNYLMLGDAARSQDLLGRLERQYPDSRFQSEALRSSGDNAYALEDWEDAVEAYQQFLERFPDAAEWDDSSLRLAESLWELERYQDAIPVLERVIDGSALADRVFRGRLLLAHCLVRLETPENADEILDALMADADIYGKRGEVTLVEAEGLQGRGKYQDAVTLLEGMADEDIIADVKYMRADMLGHLRLTYGGIEVENLEEVKTQLQIAAGGRDKLDDIDGTRLLLETVKDYLAAAGQVADAEPERAARLKLLQANALLFGFERPHLAFDLYAEVAADTAADTTVAPRALYGALLVQSSYLANPDSAAVFRDDLQARFPDSPQAYQARSGAGSNLLAFLTAQEEEGLAAERLEYAARTVEPGGAKTERARPGSGLRRRMVILQRRPNILYPPPEDVARVMAGRLQRERDEETAAARSLDAARLQSAPAETLTFGRTTEAAVDSVVAAPAVVDSVVAVPAVADTTIQEPPIPEPEPEPEEPPKKETPRRWDF